MGRNFWSLERHRASGQCQVHIPEVTPARAVRQLEGELQRRHRENLARLLALCRVLDMGEEKQNVLSASERGRD